MKQNNNNVDVCSIIKSENFMLEKRNNIGLIATLSCLYEGKKIAMRKNGDFDEKSLDSEFNRIISRVWELDFVIKKMSFHELLSKSILVNQKQCKTQDTPLTMFSESKKLYQICRKYILCWQTDLDEFCCEIKKQYSSSMQWIIKKTKDYLKYNMLLVYPYLEDSVGFGLVMDRALNCEPIYCYDDGLPTSNLDLISFLIMVGYCGGKCCKRNQSNKEYFRHLIMELSYLNLNLEKIDFVDLLHSAISEHSNLTYYSAPEIMRDVCKKYLLEEHTDMDQVYSMVGYSQTEWDWVAELTFLFVVKKMDWVYPYLKTKDAFVEHINNLKNEEANYERE